MDHEQDVHQTHVEPVIGSTDLLTDLESATNFSKPQGITAQLIDGDFVVFGRQNAGRQERSFLPVEYLKTLTEQIKRDPIPFKDRYGFTTNDGYYEVCIRGSNRGMPINFFLRRFAKYQRDPLDCGHISEQLALPLTRLREASTEDDNPTSAFRVHITDPYKKACIELSLASPCAVVYGPYTIFPSGRFRPPLSLKVHVTEPVDRASFVDYANRLTDSFLYEVAVRNGIALEVIKPIHPEPRIARTSQSETTSMRFPRTTIEPNVAELFGFAESARDNLPLAFLSFYQVLEYFFPYAMRELKIRQIRRELTDPKFDESDAAIMRIVSTAETAAHASEGQQVGTLLKAAVREDRLTEFFARHEDSKHFSKRGPVSGIDVVNMSDKTREIADQVASRVYKLRNRIVHAKDDPKYEGTKILLPRSQEARALGPDVQLIRLLAEEVINDAQRRI